MDTWKVIVDYDASRPLDEQDAVDQQIDRLAEAAGEVIDSGAGSGFGRRDLDYSYATESEAAALVDAIIASLGSRESLDLTVRKAEIDEAWAGE